MDIKTKGHLVIKPFRERHFPATGLHTRKGCSASYQAGRKYGKLSNEQHVTRVRKKVEEPRLPSGPCYKEDLLCISPERPRRDRSSGITLFCTLLRDSLCTCRHAFLRKTVWRINHSQKRRKLRNVSFQVFQERRFTKIP